MSDTPETDGVTERGVPSSPSSWFELAEFCGRLERERNAWKQVAEELAARMENFRLIAQRCEDLDGTGRHMWSKDDNAPLNKFNDLKRK